MPFVQFASLYENTLFAFIARVGIKYNALQYYTSYSSIKFLMQPLVDSLQNSLHDGIRSDPRYSRDDRVDDITNSMQLRQVIIELL